METKKCEQNNGNEPTIDIRDPLVHSLLLKKMARDIMDYLGDCQVDDQESYDRLKEAIECNLDLSWELEHMFTNGIRNNAYSDGCRWSAAKESKGSVRRNYFLRKSTINMLKNIEKKSGYGASDVVNDAVRFYNATMLESDAEELEEIGDRLRIPTAKEVSKTKDAKLRSLAKMQREESQ